MEFVLLTGSIKCINVNTFKNKNKQEDVFWEMRFVSAQLKYRQLRRGFPINKAIKIQFLIIVSYLIYQNILTKISTFLEILNLKKICLIGRNKLEEEITH